MWAVFFCLLEKFGTPFHFHLHDGFSTIVCVMNDILILTGLNAGDKIRHIRLSKRLRQVDVASQAKVSTDDVISIEKDRYILPSHRKRILAVLGINDDEEK